MPISEITHINDFLDYLLFQKRYSSHTLIAYRHDLESFFIFFKKEYDEEGFDATPAQIRTWLASLKEQGVTAKSINRKMSSLKSYYKYQLKKGLITVNPMTTIISLKVSKRLPSFIEEKDISTLFNHIEFPNTWEGKTDRLLLNIFYQCGVRLSELIHLKNSSIDKHNSNIKVLGKGNKERIIPANNLLLKEIEAYQNEKLSSTKENNSPFLLINEKGKQLSTAKVYKTVTYYLSLVSTNEKKSPHIMRHSFATHLTNHGADINAIKELLGHSSLASTQVYTSNSIEKLKDIHKQAHPKS